jgi:hypothetical protein
MRESICFCIGIDPFTRSAGAHFYLDIEGVIE